MKWPEGKDFAFTIVDDTDNATVENISAVYEFLNSKDLKTTKTVWVYPSRNHFTGETLQDEKYLEFIKELEQKGFEIQLHGVGSGSFSRQEIIQGYEIFKEKLGRYPSMHINHSFNPDNIYWGYKKYAFVFRNLIKLLLGKKRRFYGDEKASPHFWGDLSKKHIKYIRNQHFKGINTLLSDPYMPYKVKSKKHSNYWFSASDGHDLEAFNQLVSKENIDQLKEQKGLCIVYTHFASGFVNKQGILDETFKNNIEYLSQQNGWFVPVSELLDYLLEKKKSEYASSYYLAKMDLKLNFERLRNFLTRDKA